MPSITADSARTRTQEIRAELDIVLKSDTFVRSPGLSRLLSYICDKVLAGEASQIKEYSIALDVFGREASFDQDSDSIVRVQANRLRKRLAEYYLAEGRAHPIHITVPVGQYVAVFLDSSTLPAVNETVLPGNDKTYLPNRNLWRWVGGIAVGMAVALTVFVILRGQEKVRTSSGSAATAIESPTPTVGLPVGDEVRILAGSNHSYVDRSGKLWNPDAYFTGGTVVHSSVQHIWRTQDPAIYRTSRQGEFSYDIPLKPGVYELRLHFAETYYGPEDSGGGGEGSRVMNVSSNGKSLISGLDVLADASGGRTADVKVFTDIVPANDGLLHLSFSSVTGRGMISAIELLPGYRGHIRPVRIVARDVPYYSNDSQWWSSDTYFRGGQLGASEEPAAGTDDPELYETERWGHFSYAIPVTPGQYRLTLHFVERGVQRTLSGSTGEGDTLSEQRLFDVLCNGKFVIKQLNLKRDAGENRVLIRKVSGLEPNAQSKLILEFAPSSQYATVSAIEVVPQ